jgi:NADPH:quinone reductase-like Zn-dependent oxidoreductase
MLRKFGGPDGFAVVERPVPEPGAGEVLVRVLAASVQFTDVMLRKGQYPDLKEKPPLVLGYDLVGEVVKAGPDVASPAVGQRVAELTVTGSYAQYRTLEAGRATVVDEALDPAEATSLVLSWMTAYQLLHRDACVRKGQKLLVIGAAGAVGQALVVLGKLAGCELWGTARARHAGVVRALGATHVDSDQADFRQALPGGFDAAFDGIGEQGFSRTWRAVGARGHLSAFGVSAGVQRNVSLLRVGLWFAKLWWWNTFSGGRSTSFFSITKLRGKHPDWFAADLGQLLGMLKRGEIKPRVAERVALDAVADAHSRIERGGLEGKIVLLPNG